MNIEQLREYCLSKKGVTESIPFSKLPDLLVFKVGGKMFLATDLSTLDSITIKSAPEKVVELKEQFDGVETPSYMSPKYWIQVTLDGRIETSEMKAWIDLSYTLVFEKLTKKMQREINEQ